MKKYLLIPFFLGLAAAFSACSSASGMSGASVRMDTKAAQEIAPKKESVYENEKLGFSFTIPSSWETQNYKPEMAVRDEKESGVALNYLMVSFVFRNDRENPLLTIMAVPKGQWNIVLQKKDNTPHYLAAAENLVYAYTLPESCPYDVGEEADLYNSMILPEENVVRRFRLLKNGTFPEGAALMDGFFQSAAAQSVSIETSDGRILSFTVPDTDTAKSVQKIHSPGETLRIYYTGEIGEQNAGKAIAVKIEKIE